MTGIQKEKASKLRGLFSRHFEWSKVLTLWVMILNSFVVYHGIHLCYVMVQSGSTSYSFGWLSTLISVVVGLGDVVVTAYMYKGSKENVEKIKVGSSNSNYP